MELQMRTIVLILFLKSKFEGVSMGLSSLEFYEILASMTKDELAELLLSVKTLTDNPVSACSEVLTLFDRHLSEYLSKRQDVGVDL